MLYQRKRGGYYYLRCCGRPDKMLQKSAAGAIAAPDIFKKITVNGEL